MDKLRLLLVDDEPHILSALHRQLRSRLRERLPWLQLDVESDPLSARERLRERAYALVISDYRMPGLNGVELLSELRQLQPNCVRIMLSGQVDRDGLTQAINEAGVHRFMAKPWADEELVGEVMAGLALHQARSEQDALMDDLRLSRGELSPQEAECRRLERLEPGITRVLRDADGAVLMEC